MVRLVFRPYTQVRRAICTSAPLRASTRISPGFTLPKYSSPSFGSEHICSRSDLRSKNVCRRKLQVLQSLSLRHQVSKPFDSHICSTSWSVFQDGWNRSIIQHVLTSKGSPPPPKVENRPSEAHGWRAFF